RLVLAFLELVIVVVGASLTAVDGRSTFLGTFPRTMAATDSHARARRRSPTILDLARESGVSKTTVSRVLNGSASVAPETRERALEAMERLGFRVNLAARALRTTRSALVGLLVPAIDNEVFGRVAQRLETELARDGVSLVITSSAWTARG